MVGPLNSGKKRLLTHVRTVLESDGVPVSCLNCRRVAQPSAGVVNAFMLLDAIPQLLYKALESLKALLQATLYKSLVKFAAQPTAITPRSSLPLSSAWRRTAPRPTRPPT